MRGLDGVLRANRSFFDPPHNPHDQPLYQIVLRWGQTQQYVLFWLSKLRITDFRCQAVLTSCSGGCSGRRPLLNGGTQTSLYVCTATPALLLLASCLTTPFGCVWIHNLQVWAARPHPQAHSACREGSSDQHASSPRHQHASCSRPHLRGVSRALAATQADLVVPYIMPDFRSNGATDAALRWAGYQKGFCACLTA